MVLIAPSAHALRRLLQVCEMYAISHSILYNTDKTKCMVFSPKRDMGEPTFILQGERLKLVIEFKYLGVIITSNLKDDIEIGKRSRKIYGAGNTVIGAFKCCNIMCKSTMFRTYMYNIYCIALWCSFSVRSYAKAKVAHNDILRSLCGVPRYSSATALFARYILKNLDMIGRNAMHGLMTRLLASSNSLVRAVCKSEVRVQSRIWHRWSVALGMEWNSIMAM